jgi:tetratricopeptide (TPR) repeat protein
MISIKPKFLVNMIKLCVVAICLIAESSVQAQVNFPHRDDTSKEDYYKSLMNDDFEKILNRYAFVGDFRIKPPEREISSEIFWKYSLRLPKIDFDIPEKFGDFHDIIPATKGSSRELEHINRGRVLFLQGKYEEARETWLTARKMNRSSEFINRRIHYFIGMTYLKLGYDLEQKKGLKFGEVKANYSNAATFLGTAYRPPMNIKDEVLDQFTGKVFYVLSAIYHNFGRYPQAFEAANEGLNHLRAKGIKIHRHELRRIVAESLILNQSYMDAVQEIDFAIRQDPDPKGAASDFARVGDVYFGLNNYELAEDVYGLSIAIDKELRLISAHQAILRGESLFWLGRFDESEQMLEYGIRGGMKKNTKAEIDKQTFQFAKLRVADIYLHRSSVSKGKEKEKYLEKAKLKYFQVSQHFSGSDAANIAKLRLACMGLPFYKGHNVKHAREFLGKVKENFSFPPRAQELAMACNVGSYTQRERTPRMLEKVREFADKYPESKFLASMVEPVREVKASNVEKLFAQGKSDSAVKFYEDHKDKLYKNGISDKNQFNLFNVYFERGDVKKAKEFWFGYKSQFLKKWPNKISKNSIPSSMNEAIKRLTFLEEVLKGDSSFQEELNTFQRNVGLVEKPNFEGIDGFLLTRLKLADEDKSSLPLQVKIAVNTARGNVQNLCEVFAPTIGQYLNHKPEVQVLREISGEFKSVIDLNYLSMAKDGLHCAGGLLNMEFKLYQSIGEELTYAQSWYDRKEWKLNNDVLSHLWQASEIFSTNNEPKKASEIWKKIQEVGPKDSIEFRLSKSRLEKDKTALEDLWD